MSHQWPDELYQFTSDNVDWQRPELASLDAENSEPHARVLALVRTLRERSSPDMGYSPAYVRHLRCQASEADLTEARTRIERALGSPLLMPYHFNAFAALGAETMLLGTNRELSGRIANFVMDNRDQWTEGLFGLVLSICDLIRFLWPLEECDDEVFVPLFGWLLTRWKPEWDKAREWSERTLGTSGHNWWVHSFAGFWMAGCFFPQFKGLEQFKDLAPSYLERHLKILFQDDGWSKEGAPGYHEHAVWHISEIIHLATLNGIVFSDETYGRLQTIAAAAHTMIAPDGDYPAFADHRRAAHDDYYHPASFPGTMLRRRAARYGLPETKFVAETLTASWQPPNGVLPDFGEDLLPVYNRLESRAPQALDTALIRSGYYVMRENWTPRADWVCLEAGELGSRVTSHKHVSLFNFELYARGRRLLVDNWYGPVLEEREKDHDRMWRISSAGHNVVTIDNQDQLPILGEFLYGATVLPVVDDWRSGPEFSYFSGVHEGYRHLPNPVTSSRRKLFYLRGQYWILIDRLTPDDTTIQHDYQQHFHVNAPGRLDDEKRLTTEGAGGNLLIVPVCGVADNAEFTPSPFYVEKYENPNYLKYSGSAAGDHVIVTLLVPFEDEAAPHVEVRMVPVEADGRILSIWEATALEIEITTAEGTQRDLYFDQHMEWCLPWQAGAHSGTGRVYHSRCNDLKTGNWNA